MDPTKVTAEDLKLLELIHNLKEPPKVDTMDDLVSYMKHYNEEEPDFSKLGAAGKTVKEETTIISSKFPRISLFYGETGKGEVTYPTWKYEICCLLEEKCYTTEQVLLGIRRSVKGEAANIMRRLGTSITIDDLMTKFESTFGDIESKESILKKFYASKQEVNESVLKYASKLEEIFAQAGEIGAINPSHENTLKSVFYSGLRQPLKQMCNYKFETIHDYDKFKVEVRKIESEMDSMQKETTGKCHSANVKPEKTELGEVKELLQNMNDRIKKLELEREESNTYRGRGFRGSRHMRGNYYRGQFNRGRGRGEYRPTRPLGANNFRPTDKDTSSPYSIITCYKCNKQGHIARYCREPLN